MAGLSLRLEPNVGPGRATPTPAMLTLIVTSTRSISCFAGDARDATPLTVLCVAPRTLHARASSARTGDGRDGAPSVAGGSRMVKTTAARLPVMRRGYASRIGRSTIRASSLVGLLPVIRSYGTISQAHVRVLLRQVRTRSAADPDDSRARQRADQVPQVWRQSSAAIA